MRNIWNFLKKLVKKTQQDDISALAAELTYNLLLSFFPLLIFLITLIGFFNLNTTEALSNFQKQLPPDLYNIIKNFVSEVVNVKRVSLLSVSLIMTLYSASYGFMSMIKGINKAYSFKENRGYIKVTIVSFILLFIFSVSMVISLFLIAFGSYIQDAFFKYNLTYIKFSFIINFLRYLVSLIVLIFTFMLIYKLASSKKLSFYDVIPGSLFAVLCFTIISNFLGMYINKFLNYSKVYGSIGGVFLLIFWINLISYILLVGGEINAILRHEN